MDVTAVYSGQVQSYTSVTCGVPFVAWCSSEIGDDISDKAIFR